MIRPLILAALILGTCVSIHEVQGQAIVTRVNCPKVINPNTIVVAQSAGSMANYPVIVLACFTLGPGFTIDNSTVPPTVNSASSPITTIFGRTGAVVAVSGDYLASQVTNALDLTNIPAAFVLTTRSATFGAFTYDARAALHTMPAVAGTLLSISATCSVGEVYFATDAAAGSNFQLCTSSNTWTPVTGGGGGSSLTTQLLDFYADNAATNIQRIGNSCSPTNPCQTRQMAVNSTAMTAPYTVTITGASGTGPIFHYITSAGRPTVGHNTAATFTCSAGCDVATGVTAFPPDSLPLWQTSFVANVLATVTKSMDKRAMLSTTTVAAGDGLHSSDDVNGIRTMTTDPTLVGRYFTGSGAPGITCTAGRDLFTDITNLHLYFCKATNSWAQADAGGSRTDVQSFMLAQGGTGGTNQVLAGDSSIAGFGVTATGPNSIAFHNGVLILSVNDWVMVSKKTSSSWTAAAGTVDMSLIEFNVDGAPAAGSWNMNFYVGCAAPGANFTYGTATLVTATPVSAGFSTYNATALNLPGSCASGRPIQFWIQRVADTGGATGVRIGAHVIETVIRGN